METNIEEYYLIEIKSDWFELIKLEGTDKSYSIKLVKPIEHHNLVKSISFVLGLCKSELIKDAIESYWIDKFISEAYIRSNDK
jgi:hypothetical protein